MAHPATSQTGRADRYYVYTYLSSIVWRQVARWLLRKHRRIEWKRIKRRYFSQSWWPATDNRRLFNPSEVHTTRYRYRGTAIPHLGQWRGEQSMPGRTGHVESPVRGRLARRVRERGQGKFTGGNTGMASRADLTSSCPGSAPRRRWPSCLATRSLKAPWRG
jgi:hypothetical protein